MAIKAYVLIITNPGRTKEVLAAVRDIPGIVEVHEVMGPYDIVAELEVQNLTDVPPILGDNIRKIEGVQSTTSLVTFPS